MKGFLSLISKNPERRFKRYVRYRKTDRTRQAAGAGKHPPKAAVRGNKPFSSVYAAVHCASGSKSEKNRKKVRRTSTPDTKRRRKANEKTNTQHPAPMLHVADAADDAADDCVCSG